MKLNLSHRVKEEENAYWRNSQIIEERKATVYIQSVLLTNTWSDKKKKEEFISMERASGVGEV